MFLALGAAFVLAACATVDSPRLSSSATVRCMDGPGRGGSVSEARPLFFLFCAQSP
ncbi:MAG TPA: hypothetical protein VN323_18530 [Candidatus Dormibacteraeota bacterium]|jgi:hypothetical protein|nr:hypothetical protein [Candidatus Dormibacteraeota bacterium]